MKTENTQKRLAYIMDARNIRQVDILKKCEPLSKKYGVKIGKSDLSQYVHGKTEPSQDKLIILGMALNVSEAWLMGFDVPMERTDNKTFDCCLDNISNHKSLNTELSPVEKNLITTFRAVNTHGQQKILDYAEDINSSDKYKKIDYTEEKQSS